VVVVRSFEELETVQVKGKIVCFNVAWVRYGETVAYRSQGPSRVQRLGGVGMLLRSVTPFSIDSPHTGSTHYDPNFPLIPAAAISLEDAEMLQRMQDRGQKIEVHLHIESEWYKSRSDNLIAEITGEERPEEVLVLGGHFDSWDVGSQTGAVGRSIIQYFKER
jgi:carboxypeptidase Q